MEAFSDFELQLKILTGLTKEQLDQVATNEFVFGQPKLRDNHGDYDYWIQRHRRQEATIAQWKLPIDKTIEALEKGASSRSEKSFLAAPGKWMFTRRVREISGDVLLEFCFLTKLSLESLDPHSPRFAARRRPREQRV